MGLRRRFGRSKRDRQNCISTKYRFVLSTIKVDHGLIELSLFRPIHANQFSGNGLVDILNRLENTFTTKTRLVAIAQLYRLA